MTEALDRALPQARRRLRRRRLYEMYLERIAAYRADPPPPDWTGVYEAESK